MDDGISRASFLETGGVKGNVAPGFGIRAELGTMFWEKWLF